MQNNNNAVAKTTGAVGTANKTITDKVLNSVSLMTTEQGLVLPKNYNPSNALKAAYLKLAENNLLNTDQTALAQALLNMCIQGLNPAKNQCYFINYGGKVGMLRSYFGDRCACITSGLVKDIQANIIYEGDTVNVTYEDGYMVVEHTTNWENFSNPIKGAYAMAIMPDGTKRYDLMTYDRIKKSWSMSRNQSNNKLQTTYDDDACKRTVIRHLVKNIFNQSTDDNLVVDSYCSTTADENIFENAESAMEQVEQQQAKVEGTKKPEVVVEAQVDEAPQEEINFDNIG